MKKNEIDWRQLTQFDGCATYSQPAATNDKQKRLANNLRIDF